MRWSSGAHRVATPLVLVVLGLALTACAGAAPAGDAAVDADCDPTPVERRGGAASVRAGAEIEGLLFYYDETYDDVDVAVMPPHGRAGADRSTKILWQADVENGTPLTVDGTNLTGQGRFEQSFPEAVAPQGDYPSIVELPGPGCWELSLAVGDANGTVTFRSDAQ